MGRAACALRCIHIKRVRWFPSVLTVVCGASGRLGHRGRRCALCPALGRSWHRYRPSHSLRARPPIPTRRRTGEESGQGPAWLARMDRLGRGWTARVSAGPMSLAYMRASAHDPTQRTIWVYSAAPGQHRGGISRDVSHGSDDFRVESRVPQEDRVGTPGGCPLRDWRGHRRCAGIRELLIRNDP